MNRVIKVVALMGIIPLIALAAPAVLPVPPVVGVPILDKIIAFLADMPGTVYIVIAAGLEFLFRMVKSDKPKSILWGAYEVLGQIGKLAGALAEVLDKVLPQRLNSGPK